VAFSKRSWPYLVAAAVPWLLCAGQRSVTRLWAMGAHRRSRSGYYRWLSDGKWRLEVFFRCLFDLIVRTFRLASLELVLDDTLWPKWGRGIFGTGLHFDHAARPRAGYVWGHDWVVRAMVALTAVEVVEAFARRWTIEQMFSVAKNQLGLDSAEVRKERSVRRHAALCLALVTWVEVGAYGFTKRLRARPFSAKLAAVREEAVEQTIFACAPRRGGLREMAGTLAELFSTATRAA